MGEEKREEERRAGEGRGREKRKILRHGIFQCTWYVAPNKKFVNILAFYFKLQEAEAIINIGVATFLNIILKYIFPYHTSKLNSCA